MFFTQCLIIAVLLTSSVAHAASVKLLWNAPGIIPAPLGYIMERKTGHSGVYAEVTDPLARPTMTSWTDNDIPANGVRLCWQVRAFNELGATRPSNELCLSLPDVPEDFRLEVTGSSPSASRLSIRTTVKKKR